MSYCEAKSWRTSSSLPSLVGKITFNCQLLVQVDWGLTDQGLLQENKAVVGQ